MNKDFMSNLKATLNNEFNVSVTENGAVGYRTTGKNLLDLNFAVASLRNATAAEIQRKYAQAFYDDKITAVKWLFYAGDVRGGVGERRLFKICINWLADQEPEMAKAVMALIPEYTRWDNVFALLGTQLEKDVFELVTRQLTTDMKNYLANNSISLCAKWMPSINTSSKKTRRLAAKIVKRLNITEASYRKMLSALRKYLDVTEVKMSAKKWDAIDYQKVPSRANLIYNGAFLRNDEERRREYLGALEKGEVKINSAVLFPHDIANKYLRGCRSLHVYDAALEGMWKNLPDYVKENGSTLCVVDGSGSMEWGNIGNTNVTALTVANALGIYFAERCSGAFKDKIITFSSRPQFIDLSNCQSLKDKLSKALSASECSNTDIEKTFDLILTTAVKNNMSQNELPKNILVLSDMEFDSATCQGYGYRTRNQTLFDTISNKFSQAGYKMPRLVFWNLNSRTGTIPVKENDLGVALVSGFSPAIVKMVLSGKLDPYECLLEQLNAARYEAVEKALRK